MTPNPAPEVSAPRLAAWRRLCGHGPAGAPGEPSSLEIETLSDRRERAQASRLVRGVLRNLSLLDAWLARPALFDPQKTAPALRWILRLAAYEKIFQSSVPDYAIGAQAVTLARQAGGPRAAGFMNAIVRRLLPTLPPSPEALHADPFTASLRDEVRWSVPEGLARVLGRGYGKEEVKPVLRALAEEEAPVWLRVNTLKTASERLSEELGAEGVQVAPPPLPLPEALLFSGGERLPWETEAWARGELTVQDIGAMLAARLLDPQPGEAVLDLCAAPGGKTGHLWERMRGQGRLVALEVVPPRREEMRLALLRLYGPDHPIELPDCDSAENLGTALGLPAEEPAIFDRLLIDAPCQALGLIRRHPEIRWDGRLAHQQEMTATQRHLLAAGARYVKPGGRLLWVTCSPTAGENEVVLADWLAAHPDWSLADPSPHLPEGWLSALQLNGPIIRTRPDRIACDGFAMALLQRDPLS